jgi:hypothetical protein
MNVTIQKRKIEDTEREFVSLIVSVCVRFTLKKGYV